jgi:hypothetical protein
MLNIRVSIDRSHIDRTGLPKYAPRHEDVWVTLALYGGVVRPLVPTIWEVGWAPEIWTLWRQINTCWPYGESKSRLLGRPARSLIATASSRSPIYVSLPHGLFHYTCSVTIFEYNSIV